MDESEAAYLSWFYSKEIDSEWEMQLTDKQKDKIIKTLKAREPEKEITLVELRERLFGKEE